MSEFACINCNIIDENTVYECYNCGAPHCKKCVLVNKVICWECKCKDFRQSFFALKMIQEIDIICNKCSLSVKRNKITDHSLFCEGEEVNCAFIGCKDIMKKKDAIYHIFSYHSNDMIKYFSGNYNVLNSLKESKKQNLENYPSNPNFIFQDNSPIFTMTETSLFTVSSVNFMNKYGFFKVKIYIKQCENVGYITLGFIDKFIKEKKGYLGGDLGSGNIGFAGNGAIGSNGKWISEKGSGFKEKDVIELLYDKGVCTYSVNGIQSPGKVTLITSSSNIYFAVTVYHNNTSILILDI